MTGDVNKAVFLSYASQDAEAARRICDSLRAADVEVWFDQSELRGGDAWDQKIRRQIRDCVLFLPVVSTATQARREGYFRLEWKLADDRTHLMAKGTPFIVPVCVDDTKDWDALVPDSFMNVQWTRLPGGETPSKFCERVVQLLAGGTTPPMEPGRPRPGQRDEGVAAPAKLATPTGVKTIPMWTLALSALVVIGAGLFFALRPKPAAPATPARVATTALPRATSAEFPRDPDLKRAHQLVYSLDAITEDFALAEDMVKGVEVQRPNDPEAVTVHAEIAVEFLVRGFDTSQARRALAQRLAERAAQLAPDSADAQATLGRYLGFINAQLPRAEELLRRAIELRPTEPRYHRALLNALVRTKPDAELDAFAARMVAQFPTDPLVRYDIARRYKDTNRLVEMERALDETLALAPIAFAMVWKSWLALEVHADVAGMKMWLDRVPERQRTNTRFAHTLSIYAGISGETAAALKQLGDLPDSWLTDFDFTGPKALLMGDLLALDGRKDLARLQYEAALAEIQREKTRTPTDLRPRRAEAWTLLGLDRRDEARATMRVVFQSLPRPYRWTFNNSWWSGPIRLGLLLGERPSALALLKEAAEMPASRAVLRILFQVDARMAPFRDGPEIVALLAEPKKEISATPVPVIDQKSVAVLAFANLSDDKDNAYFSDGISEELLNVLAKIPGLKVSARTSAFSFKGKNVAIPEIAKQLGVAYVVEGSVRKAGGKVRITAQLVKAEGGFHVWSDTFTRDLKDIFAVQDEIAGLIAKNLELKLGTKSPARTVDPEAYALRLRGQAIFARDATTEYAQGIQFYKDSLAREGNSALTWALLAIGYGVSAGQGAIPVESGFRLASEAANRALALDPELAQAHYALGLVHFLSAWDWGQAEASLQRALVLEPNNVYVIGMSATVAQTVGHAEQALALSRKAVALDPLAFGPAYSLAKSLLQTGRWTEMEQHAQRMIAVNSAGRYGYVFLTFAHLLQGHVEAAAKALEPMKGDLFQLACVAMVRHAQGRSADSDAALREMETKFAESGAYQIAEAYAFRNQPDRAFEWLERGYRDRDAGLTWAGYDPILKNLRADPRWPALLQKMNLPDSAPK